MTPEQQRKWDRVIAWAKTTSAWSDAEAALAADAELKELRSQLAGRFALQSTSSHPAPCAHHCEARAFEIDPRTLKQERGALLYE